MAWNNITGCKVIYQGGGASKCLSVRIGGGGLGGEGGSGTGGWRGGGIVDLYRRRVVCETF